MLGLDRLAGTLFPMSAIRGPLSEADLYFFKKKTNSRASLVAQWLRIGLPMQGTQVRALVQEDPTCHGAAKPVRHNY